jgi:hypothetical protein
MLASPMPRFLYMIELAAASATKGNPMANHVVGTQLTGFFLALFNRSNLD